MNGTQSTEVTSRETNLADVVMHLDGFHFSGDPDVHTYQIKTIVGPLIVLKSREGDVKVRKMDDDFYMNYSYSDAHLERTRLDFVESLTAEKAELWGENGKADGWDNISNSLNTVKEQWELFLEREYDLKVSRENVQFQNEDFSLYDFLDELAIQKEDGENIVPLLDSLSDYFKWQYYQKSMEFSLLSKEKSERKKYFTDGLEVRPEHKIEEEQEELLAITSCIAAIQEGMYSELYDKSGVFDEEGSQKDDWSWVQKSCFYLGTSIAVLGGALGIAACLDADEPAEAMQPTQFSDEYQLMWGNIPPLDAADIEWELRFAALPPTRRVEAYRGRLESLIERKYPRTHGERSKSGLQNTHKKKKSGGGITPNVYSAKPSNDVVFNYRSIAGKIYWKTHEYDQFDGKSWTGTGYSSPEDERTNNLEISRLIFSLDSDSLDGSSFLGVYEWEANRDSSTKIPWQGDFLGHYTVPFPSIELPSDLEQKIVEAVEKAYIDLELADFDDLRSRVLSNNLEILSAVESVERAVQDYFSYILFDPALNKEYDESDDVMNVLTKFRKGDCDIINTYLVGVLRRLGIPARLASGYLTMDGVGRFSDAHAWAEAYSQEHGWIIADATPYLPPSENEQEDDGMLIDMDNYAHSTYRLFTEIVLNEDRHTVGRLLSKFGQHYSISAYVRNPNSEDFVEILSDVETKSDPKLQDAKRIAYFLLYSHVFAEKRTEVSVNMPPYTNCEERLAQYRQELVGILHLYRATIKELDDPLKGISMFNAVADRRYTYGKVINRELVSDLADYFTEHPDELLPDLVTDVLDTYLNYPGLCHAEEDPQRYDAAIGLFETLPREFREHYFLRKTKSDHTWGKIDFRLALVDSLDERFLNHVAIPGILAEVDKELQRCEQAIDKLEGDLLEQKARHPDIETNQLKFKSKVSEQIRVSENIISNRMNFLSRYPLLDGDKHGRAVDNLVAKQLKLDQKWRDISCKKEIYDETECRGRFNLGGMGYAYGKLPIHPNLRYQILQRWVEVHAKLVEKGGRGHSSQVPDFLALVEKAEEDYHALKSLQWSLQGVDSGDELKQDVQRRLKLVESAVKVGTLFHDDLPNPGQYWDKVAFRNY